jgi:copper chaperone
MNTFNIKVEDMTCGHCKARIEKSLIEAVKPSKIEVDLGTKTVVVETEALQGEVFKAIDDAGYTPVPV